jgi:hypothetical protein
MPEEAVEDIPVTDGEETEDTVIEDAEELGEDVEVEDVIEKEEGPESGGA